MIKLKSLTGLRSGTHFKSTTFSSFGTVAAHWNLGDPDDVDYQGPTGELLTNGDVETGDTTGWLPSPNATLSVENSDPYEGNWNLKILNDGGTDQYARQACNCVTGATYYHSGVMRSDGTGDPRVVNGGITRFDGEPIASWQDSACIFKAAAAPIIYQCHWQDGTYVECDANSLNECPGIAKCNNLVNPGTYDLVQATVANQGTLQPNWGGAGGLDCGGTDGTDDYWTADALAAAVFSGDDRAWTIAIAFEHTTSGAVQALWSTGNSGDAANNLMWLSVSAANVLEVSKKDNVGTLKTVTIKTGLSVGRHVLVLRCTGTQIYGVLDGVVEVAAGDFDVGTISLDRMTLNARRWTTVGYQGALSYRDCVIYSEDIGAGPALSCTALLESRSPIA